MKTKRLSFLICIVTLLFSMSLFAANQDVRMFEHIFNQWTDAFNHEQLKPSCALFAKTMTADYQGFPTKNYSNMCSGFKKIFNQQDRRYHYDFKIHHVYKSCDLAVVRITWYLKVYQNGKVIESVQDEGLDVFKQNSNGEWQIVYYLAYPKGKGVRHS